MSIFTPRSKILKALPNRTAGRRGGTWHNHPGGCPSADTLDCWNTPINRAVTLLGCCGHRTPSRVVVHEENIFLRACISPRVPSSCIIITNYAPRVRVSTCVPSSFTTVIPNYSPRVRVSTRVPSSCITTTSYAASGVQSAHGMLVLPHL